MVNEWINEYNAYASSKNNNGMLKYEDGWLLLGYKEQLEYGTYECKLVDRKLTEQEAIEYVKALKRTQEFNCR